MPDDFCRPAGFTLPAVELRTYAESIVTSTSLEAKLRPPPADLTDHRPGPPLRIDAPARDDHLTIRPGRSVKVPSLRGMADPAQRARIIHALANHELQAAELFAWALLAFPDAPDAFRRGALAILADEQRHFRMYESRLQALDTAFGDHGITGHFWHKIDAIDTPLRFVCAMALTFENANLDFATEIEAAARDAGDTETAAVLRRVHEDEIRHVRFGWRWLDALKDDGASHWQAYLDNVQWPLGPPRARGRTVNEEARHRAGLSSEFIAALVAAPHRLHRAPANDDQPAPE